MLGQLKNKFFSIQEEITTTVKQFTPPLQDQPSQSVLTSNPGDEILEYWQIQWEAIHSAQDQNGKLASNCDRIITGIQERTSRQFDLVIQLEGLLALLPKINQDINGIMNVLGNLESLFGDVEISLLALEDTIDAKELQEKQLEQRFQMAMYQERRKAEFNELSNRLNSEYQKKKSEYERNQILLSQEKSRSSQEKFEADMRQYKASGHIQATQFRADPEATLESVDLSEDDRGGGEHQTLEAFLSEESNYDVMPLLSEVNLVRQSSNESSSTEKESNVEVLALEDIAEGAMSRTESIYYTPDATTDRLEQLTLQ